MRLPDTAAVTETWWAWRGLRVHVDRVEPEVGTTPAGTVVLVHGVGGYGRIVLPFGAPGLRAGYRLVAPDLPGYGLTDADDRHLTFDTWVDCVRDLVTEERHRTGAPVVVYGLSLGGVIAYHAVASGAPAAGLIATTLADVTDPEVVAGFSRFPRLARVGFELMKRLPMLTDPLPLPPRLTAKMTRIANNPDLAQLCATDPLGGGATLRARFWRTLTSAAPPQQPEEFTCCPVLVAHAGADQMTDIALTRRFTDRLAAPTRFVELTGAGHFPVEQPGVSELVDAVSTFLTAHALDSHGRGGSSRRDHPHRRNLP
jgi:alpha-beta hydrolase superfamily lysophospholipase